MPRETSPTHKHLGTSSSPELRASHADRDRVVEVLRVAAGEGLLTAEELDERLETALSARTLSELAALTTDLPTMATTPDGTATAVTHVKDTIRIEQTFSGAVERTGRWVLPRRLELAVTWCDVTLDLTEAVITQDTLRIDLAMAGKTLTLITRPGIEVDIDALTLIHCKLRHHRTRTPPHTPTTLRVQLTGQKAHGKIAIRPPRRTPWQRLLHRPTPH
ncbi:DUF1707 SHOCT-like domain-containing protein [Streptomyces sp. NPDC004822]